MIKYKIDVNLPRMVSIANANRYLVEGWLCGPAKVTEIAVSIADNMFYSQEYNLLRPDVLEKYQDTNLFSMFSGFSVPVIINPVTEEKKCSVTMHVKLANGYSNVFELGQIILKPYTREEVVSHLDHVETDNLLVICMATYNPEQDIFIKQIESIKQQDYANWICIISDDNSTDHSKDIIKQFIKGDNRFLLYEHQNNAGFYHNFERCLTYVPKEANYIALSDQDDIWYKNKLSTCVKQFDDGITLVFSDMRIVTAEGQVISETYWVQRRNHYKREDLDLLAIANTVTGASCVFRAELLKFILPFPPKYGDIYHDHWIALIASVHGAIKYVDMPLYDYTQCNTNVIGHYDFGNTSIVQFIAENYHIKQLKEQVSCNKIKDKFYFTYLNIATLSLDYYKFIRCGGKHIQTLISTAILRTDDKIMEKKLRSILTIQGLIRTRIKISTKGYTANNNELKLLLSLIVNKFYLITRPLLHFAYKLLVKRRLRFSLPQHTADPFIVDFKRKFAGRTLIVKNDSSRVNMLLPSLDAANFFGGYIGMLNFAKRVKETGRRVRILLTDQNEVFTSELVKIQNHDISLKEFLSEVEIEACYSHADEISISFDDVFVATSWWTAHIAHEAVAKTKYSKFIFVEQDYEPIFYEHGAYRVLAEQCYNFSHVPVYSTKLLQDFFIRKGLITSESKSEYFNNPILNFQLTRSSFQCKNRKRRLLFYARPQPHNARNLYPLGCLAIDKAGAMGYFPESDWEIIAIGGDIGEQKLPCGLTIMHIGKFDLQKYKELLPEHDLGLALMDSPHPSLLPIEMASAGLMVVTNTYEIKDADYFRNISANLLAVPSDIDCLAQALIDQSSRVGDLEQRLKGSKVNWPHTWEEALPMSVIENALNAVMDGK